MSGDRDSYAAFAFSNVCNGSSTTSDSFTRIRQRASSSSFFFDEVLGDGRERAVAWLLAVFESGVVVVVGNGPILRPQSVGLALPLLRLDDCVAVDLSVEIAFCESAIGTRRSL